MQTRFDGSMSDAGAQRRRSGHLPRVIVLFLVGFSFSNCEKGPSGTDGPETSPRSFTLSVSVGGGGAGAVNSSPAGISCGSVCSQVFTEGTRVNLTASATQGSEFESWSGACSGSNPVCQVTMDAAKSVSATFKLIPQPTPASHRLTVAIGGGYPGTVKSNPPGIDCGSDCTEDYQEGTVVTLNATPGLDVLFEKWTGDCTGVSDTCQVTMTAAKSVTANFVSRNLVFPLTVSRDGSGSGAVTSDPAGIDCGSDCEESFVQGTVVTLTATPDGGSVFSGWSGACSGSDPTCQVTVEFGTSVTATFDTAPSTFFMPLDVGKQWRYLAFDTSTVVDPQSGVHSTTFVGDRFLRVVENLTFVGRPTAKVLVFDINYTPSDLRPAVQFKMEYLNWDNSYGELSRWTRDGWRKLFSLSSPTISEGTFLMTGGPAKGEDLTAALATVSVEAGTFETLRMTHTSEYWEQYAPEHWSVSEHEYWAEGVGLVLSTWDTFIDDKDPLRADYKRDGRIELTHVDTGPFPAFVDDLEPNDSTPSAQLMTLPWAVAVGTVDDDDPGAVIKDPVANCPDPCVHPNWDGVPILQDWYKVQVSGEEDVVIDLVFDPWDPTIGGFNDLDLYAFKLVGGQLWYVGRSTSEPGDPERLSGTLNAGTYYFAVQAWVTLGPSHGFGGPVPYVLSIR